MRILYIVSTLGRSGPTNQLFSLVNLLNKKSFTPVILTLSSEPEDSRIYDFHRLDVEIYSLDLSRIQTLLSGKSRLKDKIDEIDPGVIHTQGIRADSLLSNLNLSIPWIMTSRNFPIDDYPSKFGRLKGWLMAKQHFSAMSKCKNVVSCSKSIKDQLQSVGIDSIAIQNGVRQIEGNPNNVGWLSELPRPIFVTVGSLIPRKNVKFLIEAFDSCRQNKGSLIVVGDGKLLEEFKSLEVSGVHFVGSVDNVADYLAASDYFVSSSLSEGLPNTVLEALSAGLPSILSDIPSHMEIAKESKSACVLFSLGDKEKLKNIFEYPSNYFPSEAKADALRLGREVFSAERMSFRYQELYRELTK